MVIYMIPYQKVVCIEVINFTFYDSDTEYKIKLKNITLISD